MGKLQAGSLIEVVVAMVIISIVTTVTLLIYLNTMRYMASGRQYQLESAALYYLQTYETLSADEKEGFVDDNGNEIKFETLATPWDGLTELVITLSDSLDVYYIEERRLIFLEE
ncbi:MAG: type II secretion system protein [Bacteroidota bacterium]